VANFRSQPAEPEINVLAHLVRPGDWVIDVGANLGLYTVRLSNLVGPQGRVFAFEPIPETFGYLAHTVQEQALPNVTLISAAASDSAGAVRMSIPVKEGWANFYTASITADGDHPVYALPIDRLGLDRPVTLVKIDAEGHEPSVIKGMVELIRRDHPVIIFEANGAAGKLLESLGYELRRMPGSSNMVAEVKESAP
jgi:FkbM family methyltransferase